jgi:hypothetical protein
VVSTKPRPPGDEQRVRLDRLVVGPQEDPQRARVEHPVDGRPHHYTLQQLAIVEQLLEPAAYLPQNARGRITVQPHLAGDPADDALGAALTVHESHHQRSCEQHHHHAGQCGRRVAGVDTAHGDRHHQRHPEDQVEHHRRPQSGGGEGESGVRTAHARQRQQPISESRSGCAAAGHRVRERLGAHLDPEHPHA